MKLIPNDFGQGLPVFADNSCAACVRALSAWATCWVPGAQYYDDYDVGGRRGRYDENWWDLGPIFGVGQRPPPPPILSPRSQSVAWGDQQRRLAGVKQRGCVDGVKLVQFFFGSI